MPALTASPSWQALATRHAGIKDVHLRDLFADDPGQAQRFSAEGADVIPGLDSRAEPALGHDSSANALIERYRRLRA